MATDKAELLPCPFCGGDTIERADEPTMYCRDCEAQGPMVSFGRPKSLAENWNTRTPPPPSEPLVDLHPATNKLVDDFASALKAKLLLSQQKYGWANEWARDDWKDECQQRLLDHLAKGDPRDVAAYCAFLWSHAWETAALPAPADDVAKALEAEVLARIDADEAAMIAERKAQYGERFNGEQLAAIEDIHRRYRIGVKKMSDALAKQGG